MQNKVNILEIKQALWDQRFRDLFPELKADINKFLHDPGCSCNVPLYRKILGYKDALQKYFPTKVIETPEEEMEALAKNEWRVINCHKDELEEKLRRLGPGRKQIAVARFEDQVTVVINELNVLF